MLCLLLKCMLETLIRIIKLKTDDADFLDFLY